MSQITVRFGDPLRKKLGVRKLSLSLPEQANVVDLLAYLANAYPEFQSGFQGDDLQRSYPYVLFINGRPITPPNYETTFLKEGDVVHIVLPVVGGAHG